MDDDNTPGLRMAHKYDNLAKHLADLFSEMRKIGLPDVVAKGGVGEILLANCLTHDLPAADKGADGVSQDGKKYEYKVSITGQFNFHFGTREDDDAPRQKIERHFEDIEGAFCAHRIDAKFKTIAYCPTETLRPFLITHFESNTGKQLNKNISLREFLKIPGAKVVPIPPQFQA